jgi:hypothetical protein
MDRADGQSRWTKVTAPSRMRNTLIGTVLACSVFFMALNGLMRVAWEPLDPRLLHGNPSYLSTYIVSFYYV